MKCALITGISGQDGSYLAEFLLQKEYKVVGIIRRHSVAENQTERIEHIRNNIDRIKFNFYFDSNFFIFCGNK